MQNAEAGTAVDVAIDRDMSGGVAAVQKFVDSYNAIRNFFDEQRKTGSPLYADSSLRRVVDSFTAALRTAVSTNGTYSQLAIAGVALDRYGILTIDQDKLKTALTSKPTEVEALFGFNGIGSAFVSATDNATQFGTGAISLQVKNIDARTIRLKVRQTEAKARIETHRASLVQQFTNMEVAISRLNQQRSSLASITSALQNSGN